MRTEHNQDSRRWFQGYLTSFPDSPLYVFEGDGFEHRLVAKFERAEDAAGAVAAHNAALDAAVSEAAAFDNADWFWRAMDPDDSGPSPSEALNVGMVGRYTICEVACSYSGPTRYGFIASTLDPDSDDEEFLHFATHEEAMIAAGERLGAHRRQGETPSRAEGGE